MISAEERKREFTEWEHWTERIANGCKEMRELPYIGIPSLLPRCNLTNDACRFDICPKRKEKQKQ